MHHDHRQSVSIAGDGIEIGRLQIHLDEKRTSHIKSQILEARLDDSASLADTDSKLYQLVTAHVYLKSAETKQRDGKSCANH